MAHSCFWDDARPAYPRPHDHESPVQGGSAPAFFFTGFTSFLKAESDVSLHSFRQIKRRGKEFWYAPGTLQSNRIHSRLESPAQILQFLVQSSHAPDDNPLGSGTLVPHKGSYVLDEEFCIGNPGDDLSLLKADEIDIVALLPTFKEVVINASHFLGYSARSYIMLVEKAAYAGVFRRSQAVFNEKRRNSIETGVVEAIDTRAPPSGVGKYSSFPNGLACPFETVPNEVPASLCQSLLPSCSTL